MKRGYSIIKKFNNNSQLHSSRLKYYSKNQKSEIKNGSIKRSMAC